MLVTNLKVTEPTVIVIDGMSTMLAPGFGSSFLVRSFTDPAKTYPFHVSVDRDGRVSVSCECPSAQFSPQKKCKHEWAGFVIINNAELHATEAVA